MGATDRAYAHNPAVAKADDEIHKHVQETATLAQATAQTCM